jgi:UDP-N-acetylmuramoylalanine--D-glutamate ligase
MTIELLAKQGAKKIYTNLAGRTYDEIMFRRKDLYYMFATEKEEENKRELVAKIKDVNYINDSCSINPNITWFTMEQIANKIIWIVEDNEGKQDYTSLMNVSREKVGVLICFGENIEAIRQTFQGIIPSILPVNNVNEAVLLAEAVAQEKDIVLFSSANGEPKDIERRGISYRKAVNNL